MPRDSRTAAPGECFLVNPMQPTLVTTATRPAPVDFGQPITDTVALSGTAHQAGTNGTGPRRRRSTRPRWRRSAAARSRSPLFGPDSCSTVAHGPITLTVSGDDATYGGAGATSRSVHAGCAGPVHVRRVATAATPRTPSASRQRRARTRPDAEMVTVQQIPTAIIDEAELCTRTTRRRRRPRRQGTSPAGGNVLFELFTNATCTGTAAVLGDGRRCAGGGPSAEVSTNNTHADGDATIMTALRPIAAFTSTAECTRGG